MEAGFKNLTFREIVENLADDESRSLTQNLTGNIFSLYTEKNIVDGICNSISQNDEYLTNLAREEVKLTRILDSEKQKDIDIIRKRTPRELVENYVDRATGFIEFEKPLSKENSKKLRKNLRFEMTLLFARVAENLYQDIEFS